MAKPPTAEEAAARAAWFNKSPIDRALCDVEAWARAILAAAGLSTDVRAPLWYSDNRNRLGEPEKDPCWLAWRALDACLLARQRLAEGKAELAIEYACDAWRFAFWPEVIARRRTVEQNRANAAKAHGVPDYAWRRAAYQAARARGEGKEQARETAGKECGCSAKTIQRALKH
jgi:hypothetical protein